MKIKISKTVIYLSIFLSTLTVVALTFAYYPSHGTAAGIDVDAESVCAKGAKDGGNKYVSIAKYSDPIDEMTDCYHETVNKLFNEKIKAMVKLGKTGNEADLKKLVDQLSRPISSCNAGAKEGSTKDSENLSTYCLSQYLVIEFAQFREGMNALRKQMKANAGAEIAQIERLSEAEKVDMSNIGDSGTMAAQKDLFANFGAKINRIDSEVKIAQESLDQGLAAYNELQFALPLHMKYKKIISGLEDYRDKLADIRHAVDLYPITFIDVTTAACN